MVFPQKAVGYLDRDCRREIEENQWLKEEVRGSLACSLSWWFMLEMPWPRSELFPVMGLGRLQLAKESNFPVINL